MASTLLLLGGVHELACYQSPDPVFLWGESLLEKWRGVALVTPPDFRIEEGEDATMTSPLRERTTKAPTLLLKGGYLFFRNSEVC